MSEQHPPALGAIHRGAPASVTFRRRYPVPPRTLWVAVTAPDSLAAWLGPVHGDTTVGGTYEVRMGADEPGTDQNATGDVRACDPPWSYAVGWGFPGERPSEIEVAVEPAHDGGTDLVLRHTALGDDQAVGYGAGWHTSLDRLDDHLAGREVRDWDALFEQWLPRYREAAGR